MPLYRRPGSPHWWVRIGRRTRRSTGTEDRAKAEEFERVLDERLWRLNKLGDRSAVAWAEAAEQWLTRDSKKRSRDREIITWLDEEGFAEHPVSSFAEPDALEGIRQLALAEGWTHATADRIMGTVSAVLHYCVERRYLEHAPKVPMYRPAREEPRWLTKPELTHLCKELPPHLALAARFAVQTMLRMRAMLGLTWDRIDLGRRTAWVPRSQMKAGRTFGLPLNSEAVLLLKELRQLNPEGERVFQWRGKPVDDCNTLAFQEAVKRAGVAPFRWHDLRHTGASWAVQSGVTLQELMTLMDVRSYAIVLRYAHLAPSHAAQAAEKVAQWAHSGQRGPVRRRAVSRGESAG